MELNPMLIVNIKSAIETLMLLQLSRIVNGVLNQSVMLKQNILYFILSSHSKFYSISKIEGV